MLKYKLLISSALTVLLFVGCGNKSDNKEITSDLIKNPITASGDNSMKGMPQIQFDSEQHDFGLILQGEKVSYTFKFRNIGSGDLIIKDASASCGCTVPKFSHKPIKAGEMGEIEVIFDSSNRTGRQLKTVSVWSNCQPNKNKLQIVTEIVVPK